MSFPLVVLVGTRWVIVVSDLVRIIIIIMSFCRITGRARNLPKPNFFPIIPPISPADAQKLCRVTGKRDDDHHYVPLLEAGRRPGSSR